MLVMSCHSVWFFFSGRIASREQKLTLGPRLGGMKGKIQRILLGGKSVPLRVV